MSVQPKFVEELKSLSFQLSLLRTVDFIKKEDFGQQKSLEYIHSYLESCVCGLDFSVNNIPNEKRHWGNDISNIDNLYSALRYDYPNLETTEFRKKMMNLSIDEFRNKLISYINILDEKEYSVPGDKAELILLCKVLHIYEQGYKIRHSNI